MLARRPILALALTLLAGAMPAFANTFPTQPVRFIVPFPPGGSADALTRMLAQRMQAAWGQAVVVAKAAPDGHTIALVIPSLAVNPSIMAQLPYDTVKDLAGVTLISTLPIALFATPSLPVNNVAELVAYAKKNPKTLSYGSARLGSTSHLAGLMLNQLAGVDLVHVPYKGSAPAQQDLIGGRLTLLFDSFISQLPMVQAGRVKLVAPAGPRRLPGFPDAAPIGDTVKGFNVESYFGVIAPRATPPAVLAQIHQAIKKAMEDPAVSSWMATQGMVPAASTPAQFDAFIQADMKKWAAVVKSLGGKIA
jgi:tripartite-type tricarboxylate transporter receptor subunit TctC